MAGEGGFGLIEIADEIPITTGFSGKMEAYNREAPAMFAPSRGPSPKGLTSMNPHNTADNCIRVPLHSKKYPGLFALIDSEDAELVNQYHWKPYNIGRPGGIYAHGRLPLSRKLVSMHRAILGLSPDDPDVDHIDGDGLNNRKQNLRLCNDSQNQANQPSRGGSSRFRGVTWHRSLQKWQANARSDTGFQYLGVYDTEEEAALAYDAMARGRYGEFAAVNFPNTGERSAVTGEMESV